MDIHSQIAETLLQVQLKNKASSPFFLNGTRKIAASNLISISSTGREREREECQGTSLQRPSPCSIFFISAKNVLLVVTMRHQHTVSKAPPAPDVVTLPKHGFVISRQLLARSFLYYSESLYRELRLQRRIRDIFVSLFLTYSQEA